MVQSLFPGLLAKNLFQKRPSFGPLRVRILSGNLEFVFGHRTAGADAFRTLEFRVFFLLSCFMRHAANLECDLLFVLS